MCLQKVIESHETIESRYSYWFAFLYFGKFSISKCYCHYCLGLRWKGELGDNDDERRGFVISNDREEEEEEEKKQSRQLHTRKLEYTLLKNNLHF